MEVIRVPLDTIVVENRLRPVDVNWAEVIAGSILDKNGLEGDLDTPVIVSQPRKDGKRWLLDGGHRFAAYDLLNRNDIPAIEQRTLVGDNETAALTRQLFEVDANLIRHELNPLDRAIFLAKRQDIYEALNPETKKGAINQHTKPNLLTDIVSFSKDAAEKTGLNERTIRRSVTIARNIPPEHRARIAGTKFAAKQSNLLDLAKHGPEKQAKILDQIFADSFPAPSVAAAVKMIDGKVERMKSPEEKALEKMQEIWVRAGAKLRGQFLDFLVADGAITADQILAAAE